MFGQDLSEAETLLRLKRWLIYGMVHLDSDEVGNRDVHVFDHKARTFVANPSAEELAMIPQDSFNEEELACLR